MNSGSGKDRRPEEHGGLGKPATLRQCHEVIEAQALQIAQLREQIALLQVQMALLQERLTLDSRNSSKPPSSDGPAGGNRAQRWASTRKRGAQAGHKGSFRATLDQSQVDSVECPPPVCDKRQAGAGRRQAGAPPGLRCAARDGAG